MANTIDLYHGQPDYNWMDILFQAIHGTLVASGNSATFTLNDYDPGGDGIGGTVVITLTGSGLVSDGDGGFSGGTITHIQLKVNGTTVGDMDFDTTGSATALNAVIHANNYGDAVTAMQAFAFVAPTVINGSDDSDNIGGGGAYDVTINAGNGDDMLEGGRGTNDSLSGGSGDDYIVGGAGQDTIDGGSGYDAIAYEQAFDASSADHVHVTFNGDGVGTGTISGEFDGVAVDTSFTSIERFRGTLGNDFIQVLDGAEPSDDADRFELKVGHGNNEDFRAFDVSGGAGNDTIQGATDDLGGKVRVDYESEQWMHNNVGDRYGDNLDGDNHTSVERGVVVNLSTDTISTAAVAAATQQASVTLAAGTALDTFGDTDTFIDVHSLRLTDTNDYFTAAGSDQQFDVNGRDGNDTIIGGTARDWLRGGDGDDSIFGGGGGDINHGTDENPEYNDARDDLDGGDGNDTLDATGGYYEHDGYREGSWLNGGRGNDLLIGSRGGDDFVGGSGKDTITGGEGQDRIRYQNDSDDEGHGGDPNANDTLAITFSGEGNGTITGFYGSHWNGSIWVKDSVDASFTSIEQVLASNHADTFTASVGTTVSEDGQDFWLHNPDDNDADDRHLAIRVVGNAGDDTFTDNTTGFGGVFKIGYNEEQWQHPDVGDEYGDNLDGHNHASPEPGVIVNFGGSTLTVDTTLHNATGQDAGKTVASGHALDTYGDTDTFNGNIHAFELTDAADYFVADDRGFSLNLNNGNDTFVGGAGADNVDGGAGNDSLLGGAGNDWLGGRGGDDYIDAGDGDDDVNGGKGEDTIDGGAGWDNLNYDDDRDDNGDNGPNGVIVNLSNANLTNVSAEGQANADVAAHTALDSWGDVDHITNIESINGTRYGDYIVMGDGDSHVSGNDGDDTIIGGHGGWVDLDGGGGNDVIDATGAQGGWVGGWRGNDVITVGDGNIDVDTGAGDDLVTGGAGHSFINLGAGRDTIDGGANWDEVSFNTSTSTNSHIAFVVTGAGSGTIDGFFDSDRDDDENDTDNFGKDTGSVNGTTFQNIEVLVGSNGNDTFTINAGGTADGDIIFWNRRDYHAGDRAIALVGGGGDDIFTDSSGRPGGSSVINYDEEKWSHRDSNGNGYDGHTWGERDNEEGVIVNLSSVDHTVNGHLVAGDSGSGGHARDTFGATDTIVGVQAFRLTDTNDAFFAGNDSYGYEADGRGGDDTLIGGAGSDLLVGDDGNDSIDGGAGNDSLSGGADDDTISGGTGHDRIDGNDGNDVLIGGAGNDVIDGGDGYDKLDYRAEEQEHSGGAQGVVVNLRTGRATDTYGNKDIVLNIEAVAGTSHDDLVIGRDDHSTDFYGSGGNDTFTAGSGGGDTVNYQGIAGSVVINLGTGVATKSAGGADHFTGVENAVGSHGADSIVGSSGDNELSGLEGNDTITTGGGFDTVVYAYDQWNGGTQGVTVNLSSSTTAAAAGGGSVTKGTARDGWNNTDTFTDAAGIDAVMGSLGADKILAGSTALTMYGLRGNDTLTGGSGLDTANYSRDANFGGGSGIHLNFGNSTGGSVTDGFGDTDTLSSVEIVIGTNNDDSFQGGSGANNFQGLGGNDYFESSAGNDTFNGGDGTDHVDYSHVFTGGTGTGLTINLLTGAVTGPSGNAAGNDTLISIEEVTGTARNDNIIGTNGNAWYDNGFWGLAGNDTLTGNGGFDIAYYDQDELNPISGNLGNRGVIVNLGSSAQVISAGMGTATGQGTGQFTLAAGTARDGFGNTDTLSGIEGIQGTSHADIFFGNATGTNFWQGLAGNDTINGTSAFDIADYTQDESHGATHGVTVNLSGTTQYGVAGGHALDGFGDTDTLSSIDMVRGTSHGDVLIGDGSTVQYLEGQRGDDTIVGGGANMAVYDSDANYGADGGVYVDLAGGFAFDGFHDDNGNSGRDTLVGIQNVTTSDNDDGVKGSDGNNFIKTRDGNDFVQGSLGTDTIDGGNGTFDQLSFSTASGAGLTITLSGRALVSGDDGYDASTPQTVMSGTVTGTATIDGHAGTVNTSFIRVEHVSGSQGDDTFTLDSSFVPNPDSFPVFLDYTNSNNADVRGVMDVSGGAGDDTFTDSSGTVRGALLISYDQETLMHDGVDNDHRWGSVSGQDGVIVNLSSSTQGGVASGHALDTFNNIDAINGVKQFWLTAAGDQFYGSDTGNYVNGYFGDDLLVGGAGDDLIVGGGGSDTINGGDGIDTVSYGFNYNEDGTTHEGVIVNLTGGVLTVGTDFQSDAAAAGVSVQGGTALDEFGDIDHLSNVEIVVGTVYDDVIYGSNTASTLEGGGGDDWLVGGTGDDVLAGGAGNDTLNGGNGTDWADYSLEAIGNSSAWPYRGNDDPRSGVIVNMTGASVTVNGTSVGAHTAIDSYGTTDTLISIEAIRGSEFADIIYAADGNTIDGAGGNDSLVSDAGADLLLGGEGDDTLVSGGGDDTLTGGSGNDLYVISAVAGAVTITDFTAGDKIDLSAYEDIHAFSQITITGGVIDLGNGTVVTVQGPGAGSLNAASFRFYAITGNGVVNGTTGDDYLLGGAGNDTLNGLAGNDTLDGGAGTDRLVGGTGDDVYIVDSTTDTIVENKNEGTDTVASSVTFSLAKLTNVENLTLTGSGNIDGTGNTAANVMTGNSGNNSLSGGDGNDTLNGGGGTDTLVGGKGDDLYIVDSGTVTIAEASGAGTDTLQTSLNVAALAANVENLILTGAAISGTGNALNNVITGNGNANTLDGGDGNDTLFGAEGNDTLIGGAGNDRLDGGVGADSMIGGAGNDVYVVDDAGDVVVENANEGTDTVESSISFSLAALANVENLTLTGAAATGTGNAGNNVITGNGADNTLIGGGGNDSLVGNDGNDSLVGGAGNDTLVGGEGNDTLVSGDGNDSLVGGNGDDVYVINGTGTKKITDTGGDHDRVDASVSFSLATLTTIEDLTLVAGQAQALNGTGNALANTITGNEFDNSLSGGTGNDTLYGGDGADTLDGGAGTDSLVGGDGNDVYIVDSIADIIVEAAGINSGDRDEVRYSGAGIYTLGVNLEILTLTSTGAVNGVGNDGDNTITGGKGNNSLSGGIGNDSLVGGGGNDTLDGGAGADTMVGGAGNDTFVVDNVGDVVREAPKGGTDTVLAYIDFSLAGNPDLDGIENLTLMGSALNATGNALANKITGTSGDNSLDGGAGNDTLIGNGGNDTFNGGAGSDSMVGGTGNDTYYVDVAGDKITDTGGTDTVHFVGASGTYTLATGLENLVLDGTSSTSAISGVGNASNNVMTGNDGANSLSGLDGNDSLFGAGGNDTLLGGNGNDTLDGGTGADSMVGGAGNDTYYVDDAGDKVVELAGGGTDTVITSINGYTLTANVENLTLGTGVVAGSGNDIANKIIGNELGNSLSGGGGDDFISGGGGDDSIDGGTGHDIILGGAGNDTFFYSDASFGGAGGSISDNSDDFFDYSAGDKFDLTGLISSDDIDKGGSDINGVIRVVDSGAGVVNVEINEGAVLHSSTTADWSAAFNIYSGSADDVTIVVDGNTYIWSSVDSAFQHI